MNKSEKELFLIQYLLAEKPKYEKMLVPQNADERFTLFRSLVNVRPPKPVTEEFLAVQDKFLQDEIAKKGVTDVANLKPVEKNIYLWKGDISTLKCAAIVNAANSQMLGCFQPCHVCIDNVIHTFAGVQLRLKCAEIMSEQGFKEPTGAAKITPAYNLPCEYIIHTVGPIVGGRLTEKNCSRLEGCYNSCLEIAVRNGLQNIAFCCISTGVFGFPPKEAAEIAVKTVRNFIKDHNIEVIFNVFKQNDYNIYSELFK